MKLNVHFFLMLIIASVASFADILIYVLKLDYWVAIAISFVIAICIICINRKKVKLKTDFEPLDIICFIVVSIKLIVMSMKVDSEWDTRNYHIYLQETPFINKINFDFFAGRTINSFQYSLGDRMHYLFRSILGYRLGTILSYYSQIIMYYQTKKLIKLVTKSESKLVPLIANMSYMVLAMYAMVGTYYIDIFSCVFILEIICLAFEEESFLKNKCALYLSFWYTGIATGIKLPNLILIAVVYVFILIKNIKNLKDIKIKDIPICLILFLLPFVIYAYDNFVQTESIMFPYYNNIFKSEYFGEFSWHDENFGIPNVLWSMIWPFAMIQDPYRAYDTKVYDFIWPIGYAIVLCFIVHALIKRKNIKEDKAFQLAILSVVMTITWAIFVMAYARYAQFLPILYVVVFSNFILNICNLNIAKFKKALLYIFVIAILIIMSFATLQSIYECIKFFPSYVLVFKKYGFVDDRGKEEIHIDGAWLVLANDSKIASMVREEGTPIYNLETYELTNEKTLKMQEELRTKKLYFLVDNAFSKRKFERLEANNFEIVKLVKEKMIFPFMGQFNYVNMYEVRYNENTEEVKKSNLKYIKEFK